MFDCGRYQQGEEALLVLLCTDAAGAPVAPDEAPTGDVYCDGNLVTLGVPLAALEPDAVVGLFYARLYLDARFTGRCTVLLTWLTAGVTRQSEANFEVAEGSDPSGAVLALTYYRRPQAEFLVQQRSSGEIFRGKNPRLA